MQIENIKRIIHASELPSLRRCASYVPNKEGGDAANLGKAVHAGIAAALRGKFIEPIICMRTFGLSMDQAREYDWMVRRAINWWTEYSARFGFGDDYQVEHPSFINVGDKFKISGTCDLTAINQDGLRIVVDFKSGRVMDDYHDQCMAYLQMQPPPARQFMYVIFDIRQNEATESPIITKADLDLWFDAVCVDLWRSGTTAGKACSYCARKDCDARNASINALATNWSGTTELTPTGAALCLEKARAFKKVLERIEDECKEMLIPALSGPLALEDGRTASLQISKNRKLDARKTNKTLSQIFTDDEILDCVEFKISAVEEVAKERVRKFNETAEKGDRLRIKDAIEELDAMLRYNGCVEETETKKVVIK